MSRRLLTLAGLAAALLPLAPANAQMIIEGPRVTWTDPVNGCTYTAWGPGFVVNVPPPGSLSVSRYGGYGTSVSCP